MITEAVLFICGGLVMSMRKRITLIMAPNSEKFVYGDEHYHVKVFKAVQHTGTKAYKANGFGKSEAICLYPKLSNMMLSGSTPNESSIP